jgi:phage regulator Rha-like protein
MNDVRIQIPQETLQGMIYLIRGQKVMLDSDLAKLYGVETRVLNQSIRRNLSRFPDDFMFQLNKVEIQNWKSHFVTSNSSLKMSLRKPPLAFTEHGVAMLSSVLRSPKAIKVNIAIIRAFVKLREILATHKDLARKVEEHDRTLRSILEVLGQFLNHPSEPSKPVGFRP